jgi:hypothetical protein
MSWVRVVLVDLESHMRYFGADGTKNTEYWDDALHMTEAGYDEFGRLVFSHIKDKVIAITTQSSDVRHV